MTSFSQLGRLFLFVLEIFKTLRQTRKNLNPFLEQLVLVYTRSLWIVIFSGTFIGAILVIQFNFMLLQHDAQSYLGGLNTSALIREVGPLIISFLLAGKIGAFTAAELGTMRVSDQISSMECLGTNPIQYLILPRFFAVIVASQMLLLLGIVSGILGSIALASLLFEVNPIQYLGSIPKFTSLWTIFCGFTKCGVYSTLVASVACYEGFHASGGAKGVGRAVTRAAVMTNLYIVIANYITSQVLMAITEVWNLR